MYDYELYAGPDYVGGLTLVERSAAYSLEMAERLGLFINTLIIWTTDHGHLLGEHSLQGNPGAELGRLYEATTRVPLLVHQPWVLGPDSTSGVLSSLPPSSLHSGLPLLDAVETEARFSTSAAPTESFRSV